MPKTTQTLHLECKAPTGFYSLSFLSVYEAEDKLIAVLKFNSKAEEAEVLCSTQGIETVSDTIEVKRNGFGMFSKQVEYYVLSDTDNVNECWWFKDSQFKAINDLNTIGNQIDQLPKIYDPQADVKFDLHKLEDCACNLF